MDVSYQVKKGDMYVHLHLDIKEGSKDTVTELKTLILRYDVNRLVLGD